MAQAAYTTPYTTSPYLTAAEFKNSPISVDYKDLILGGNQAAQDAALVDVLARASSYADNYCNQILGATIDIEVQRGRVNRNGELLIHPNYWPVLELRDLQYGDQPNNLVSLSDLTNCFIQPQQITVALSALRTSSSGPLAFGSWYPGSSRLFVRFTYVNGYANTTLAADASASAATISVTDSTGIYGGPTARLATATTPPATILTIFDGSKTENVSAASLAGNVLTLNALLPQAHSAGVAVSALPPAVKQATLLLAIALVKTRGDEAIVMNQLGPTSTRATTESESHDILVAKELLAPFRRIR